MTPIWLTFTPAYSAPRRSTDLPVLGAHAFRAGAPRSLCGCIAIERAGAEAHVSARRCVWCRWVVEGRAADKSGAPRVFDPPPTSATPDSVKRFTPGTDPLAVLRFTDAERDDLIARARESQSEVQQHRQRIATLAARRVRQHRASIRVAVRYVRIAKVPVPDARRTVGELTGQWPSLTAIRSLWNKLYPGERRPQGKAGGRRRSA